MPRKEKKFHFIYKTTNILSGKYYIGMHSTDNLEDGYLGSGKRLWYSFNKYGRENHKREILEFFDTRKELVKREEEIVTKELIKDELCMNLVKGGYGGGGCANFNKDKLNEFTKAGGIAFSNKLKSDSVFRKQRGEFISKRNEDYHRLGILHAPPNWSGKKHSNESKDKIAKSKAGQGAGETNSQYGTCWITKDGENKKINKNLLNEFKIKGWVKGRKI